MNTSIGHRIELKAAPETEKRAKKSLRVQVKDATKGLIEARFCTFGVKDLDNDITMPGAFEDGAAVLISAYGHASWYGAKPVGKGVIRVDEKGAILDGEFFMDTIDGADTFKTIVGTGDLQEYSYGYDILESGEVTEELRQKGVWRVLKKLKVYEVSPVLLGAGVDTETMSVKQRLERVAAAARATIDTDARKEFARFAKTRARLAS
jgi:HK97 family phage prohead protease